MAAAAETARSGGGGGGGAADSYIGSLISLTSKCEIRYEGVFIKIDPKESSIGLRNVRSFGTEGRKKDGPQIPPSDKIYEYILFRGSDIKDLQVLSSPPPPQPAPPPPSLHNDPAIIQTHYPPPTASATIGSSGSGADLGGQVGASRPGFPGNIPAYQTGGSLGSWGASPSLPTPNGSGLGMPMYWQGFYGPSGGIPHLQQPSMLRPPPGMQMPQSIPQPQQYPGINVQFPSLPPNLSSAPPNLTGGDTSIQAQSSNAPESPSLLPPIPSTGGLTPVTLPSTSVPIQAAPVATEPPQTLLPNRIPVPTTNVLSSGQPEVLPSVFKPESTVEESVSSKAGATLRPQSSYASSASVEFQSISREEAVTPSSVHPDPLLHLGTSNTSSQPSQTVSKDSDMKKVAIEPSKKESIKSKENASSESKEPILPTPPERKTNANSLRTLTHHSSRGRGRGRGNGHFHPTTKFMEEFDFTAMNEKFNKDEVWGHLGKSKGNLQERVVNMEGDYDIEVEEAYTESSTTETKPVYIKEDFFDSLSCNSLDRGGRNGRAKFSEQLKIDTETFGELSKHRPMNRGGRGGRGFRGGRAGAPFYGRGYGYGYGYGYGGRGRSPGRGYSAQNWES